MTRQLTDFVCGWRGFFVGNRRNWHAHHRWGVAGARGGALVAGPAQAAGLRTFVGLVTEVLARGGSVWVFGVATRADPPWGRVRPDWRPGVLSNYFFARLRRVHFARRLVGVFHPPRPVRRGRGRVSTRWGRLRAAGGVRARSAVRVAGVAAVFRRLARSAAHRGRGHVPYVRAPQVSRLRGRWYRTWWTRAAALAGATRSARPVRVVSIGRAVRAVRTCQVTRAGRVAGTARSHRSGVATAVAAPARDVGVAVPHRGRSRHARWPVPFPVVVVTAGMDLLKSALTGEVTAAGVLLVRFGGADATRPGPVDVLWNGSASAAGGLPALLGDLFVRAHRTGLFRACWFRLARSV